MQTNGRRSAQLAEWLVAGIVAVVLLQVSDWLVPPSAVPFAGHGQRFADMVPHPLALAGEFPQRILWPLLAHAAGWFGIGPPAFSQVCSAAVLAVVCWFCRRRSASWLDAVLVTAAVAVTGAVQVYKPMACFSDSLVLLLLLLAVHFVANARVFWGLVLLAAFSHEMAFFFAPWLVYVRCRAGGDWRRESLWLAGAVAIYAVWLVVVRRCGTGVAYDIAYYLDKNFWVPWLLPALAGLWAFVVLAEFGPLLAIAVCAWRRGTLGMGRWGPWLYLAGVLPMMLLAYDVMRFASFVFLPVVLGSLAFLRTARARVAFAAVLVATVGCYQWQHPDPTQQGGVDFTRLEGQMFASALVPGRVPEKGHVAFGDAMAVYRESIAMTWPTLLAALAAALLIVGLGLLLARYVPADEAPDTANDAGGTPETMRNASP